MKIARKVFDEFDNRTVYLYTLADGNIEVDICDLGARINAIRVDGIDVALGFSSVSEYMNSGSYAGSTIGRCGNRIKNGTFTLNGHEYKVTCNEGKNHLHGGEMGFDKKFFDVEENENKLVMTLISPNGDEGYPADLKLTIIYTLSHNELLIEYKAISDNDTLFNPTNHTYFNLDGEDSGDCRNNILVINSDYYTPTDRELIPTGKRAEVKDTPFDFNRLKKIGTDFEI